MDKYEYNFTLTNELKPGETIKVGVAGSGNLEVVIQPLKNLNQTTINVYTAVAGFKTTWDEVIKRFIDEYPYAGLHIELYDAGATPPVVALRLRQAIETYQTGYPKKTCYTEATARNRIYSLVDEHSFNEFLLNTNTPSPTLPELTIQVETDDGVIIGTALFAGVNVAIASQQKDFIGGSVGEVHGAKINGLVNYAIKHKLPAIVLLIDSGGVRLQEANVGEIAISEIIRSILEARSNGINVIGVICGNNGAYGGMGIISGTLDYLIVNQGARIGISGAEVIQAVKGSEVLDSKDCPLVWRIYGGRTRYLQQAAQAYTTNKMSDIRSAIITALETLTPQSSLNLHQLQIKHDFLHQRIIAGKNYNEQGDLASHELFNCSDEQFIAVADEYLERTNNDK